MERGQGAMNELKYYAHSPGATGQWQTLAEHLLNVAEIARNFASSFGAGDLAYLIGLLHDLGKFNPAFQQYLRAQHEGRSHPTVPHAIWGAALVYGLARRDGLDIWKELALPILGHHAGLDDAGVAATKLHDFWSQHAQDIVQALGKLKAAGLKMPPVHVLTGGAATRRELAIRMVFSALVDADYLDTEKHFDPGQAKFRGGGHSLEELWRKLEADQQRLLNKSAPTMVNQIRKEVYESCLRAASGAPGLYRLTVPTGGGKTRSGLAFALKHALANGLQRVIVAIPYTSIIDQTAQVWSMMLV